MSFTLQGPRRRTILLVDPDPQFRASLRVLLEAAGFTVGEAANGKEGERTAMRIRPDAMIAELMLESVDAGSVVADRLRQMGEKFPIYLMSSAASSMRSDFNFSQLGIAGLFNKPFDPNVVIQTLKARLNIN